MCYRSVTQNLSDGLRSIVMSSVGCECLVFSSIVIHQCFNSGSYVLPLSDAHSSDAGCGSSRFSWCRAFVLCSFYIQRFYVFSGFLRSIPQTALK